MSQKHVDVIFVINQNCDFVYLSEFYKKYNFTSAILLTTHYLFKNERKIIFSLFKGIIYIYTFTDFISDLEMEECDNLATNTVSIVYQMETSLKFKNQKVYENLKASFSFDKIYFMSDLGISSKFWTSIGATSIGNFKSEKRNRAFVFIKCYSLITRIIMFFKYILKTQEITSIDYEDKKIIFLSSIKRLRIKSSVKKNILLLKPYKYLNFSLKNKPYDIVNRFIEELGKKQEFDIGTTVHEYEYYFFRNINKNPLIFIDGYYPSNYPRAYIDLYVTGNFVVRDMFDIQWFSNFGKNTLKPFDFLDSNIMNVEKCKCSKIKTIILALNHAGDWTSLINRSDTDILIETFVETAVNITQVNFIIRPHPTMATEAHEGKNSLKRIREYIEWMDLPNLTWSHINLNEDLERGDLFISEYSQVLLDVFRAGKLGIICNITNRRSFMKDYEDIGFLNVSSQKELQKLIENIINNPDEYVMIQKKAMEKYNYLLNIFYEKKI